MDAELSWNSPAGLHALARGHFDEPKARGNRLAAVNSCIDSGTTGIENGEDRANSHEMGNIHVLYGKVN